MRTSFYRRWILANGVAELFGLGTTLLLGGWVARRFSGLDDSALIVLAAAAGAVVAGTLLEGVLIGFCQASVLRAALPGFHTRRWVGATAAGAAIAWTSGMLPSTVMSLVPLGEPENVSAPVTEPALWVIMLLAALMGAVLGPFLGIPQGLVLRAHGGTVRRWVAANCLAWAFGMPVVFLATALIDETTTPLQLAGVFSIGTLTVGLVVGAVHGRFLLPLLPVDETGHQMQDG